MRISDWSSDVCSSDLPFDDPDRQSPRPYRDCREQLFRSVGRVRGQARLLRRGRECRRHDIEGRRICAVGEPRSDEHTSELQSLMRISYSVFRLKKNNTQRDTQITTDTLKHITYANKIHQN